jgi:anti-anti-sigma regulatory factor
MQAVDFIDASGLRVFVATRNGLRPLCAGCGKRIGHDP